MLLPTATHLPLPPPRPQLDLRVSITGGVHFDLVKRVLRDINRSGQAPEEIIQQVRAARRSRGPRGRVPPHLAVPPAGWL